MLVVAPRLLPPASLYPYVVFTGKPTIPSISVQPQASKSKGTLPSKSRVIQFFFPLHLISLPVPWRRFKRDAAQRLLTAAEAKTSDYTDQMTTCAWQQCGSARGSPSGASFACIVIDPSLCCAMLLMTPLMNTQAHCTCFTNALALANDRQKQNPIKDWL